MNPLIDQSLTVRAVNWDEHDNTLTIVKIIL